MIKFNRLANKYSAFIMLCLILGLSLRVHAAEPQADGSTTDNFSAFTAQSMASIKADYQGQNFLLGLWSVDCPPCLVELELMGKLLQLNPDIPLVLVSTDSIEQRQYAADFLEDFNLNDIESWMFADSFVERLRYSIDPNWYGELPRSYYFTEKHELKSHSGIMTEELLAEWFDQSLIFE